MTSRRASLEEQMDQQWGMMRVCVVVGRANAAEGGEKEVHVVGTSWGFGMGPIRPRVGDIPFSFCLSAFVPFFPCLL